MRPAPGVHRMSVVAQIAGVAYLCALLVLPMRGNGAPSSPPIAGPAASQPAASTTDSSQPKTPPEAPAPPASQPAAQADQQGPPRIVSTQPAQYALDVDPALAEIMVTFDRDMSGGMSWTGGGPDFPTPPEGKRPAWRDARTCVFPVALQAGRYYRVGINSKSHQNFRSQSGVPARPTVICFVTQGATPEVRARVEPPVIVSMLPSNGATGVDPATTELRVTFDKPMGGGFSWTGGGENYPARPEGILPRWSDDRKTCILPVQLKPDWGYQLGLNSPSHNNFQSESGVPLAPVIYKFQTAAGQ